MKSAARRRGRRHPHLEPLLDRSRRSSPAASASAVAMGRAIVRIPRSFCSDEPLSNLDAKLRNEMRTEIKSCTPRSGRTVIFTSRTIRSKP